MLDHGGTDQQSEAPAPHGLVEIAAGPQFVGDDARRIEAHDIGRLTDHGLVDDHDIGARRRAWQPQIVVRHEEQAGRFFAQRRGLALKATGEPQRAAVVANHLLNVHAHGRGAVHRLMAGTHGVGMAGAGVGRASAAHDVPKEAVGGA
jgi:hypothetical protein